MNIKPYSKNARKHPREQLKKIAASIERFGFRQPVVVDKDGTIVVGHGRYQAAKEILKWEETKEAGYAPKGSSFIPFMKIEDLTKDELNAYRLADNRLNETDWEAELLAESLKELPDDLKSITGFEEDEIAEALGKAIKGEEDDFDTTPPEEAKSKLGDLYQLGEHRLLCGDATKREDVERLMDGRKADMVFTDPPYGVGYTGGAKEREALAGDEIGTRIYEEALPHLKFAAADHAALYLWYADAHAASAAAAAAAAAYVTSAQIIWVKNNAQFVSSAHYHGKHEPCFYAHRKGKSAQWFGENNEVTVWEVNRAPKNEYHPTQKPVELVIRAMGNSSKAGDLVLDLFAGSGSTLIGCEQAGRICRTMELSPAYCDVIVARWEKLTGKKAELVSSL